MQMVTFVDQNSQPIATVSMDVPRAGEQVGIAGGAFVVLNVRYIVTPTVVRVYVWLSPISAFIAQFDEQSREVV